MFNSIIVCVMYLEYIIREGFFYDYVLTKSIVYSEVTCWWKIFLLRAFKTSHEQYNKYFTVFTILYIRVGQFFRI